MTKFCIFGVLLLLLCTKVRGQCVTSNDVNEQNRELVAHNLVEGSIRFSLNLFRAITQNNLVNMESSGLFLSPYSVWSTLVVAYMGARRATEIEMKHVLGLGNIDKFKAWGAYQNLTSNYELSTSGFSSANRIYFQLDLPFKDCIKDLLKDTIAFADFSRYPMETRDIINSWVEEQTKNKIKDLLQPDSINTRTNMVIANAVYFKQKWFHQFNPNKTTRSLFTTSSGQEISVDMMKAREEFPYTESYDLECSAIELPYLQKNLSMVLLLPQIQSLGVRNIANKLTPNRLKELLEDMYSQTVDVAIPKFKLENDLELSSILPAMGLRNLFNRRLVDLSGFTGNKDFVVDAVLHKSFINVNEEGTEAAAATAFVATRTLEYFHADRPFIFLIRDTRSNLILFMGVVEKPNAAT